MISEFCFNICWIEFSSGCVYVESDEKLWDDGLCFSYSSSLIANEGDGDGDIIEDSENENFESEDEDEEVRLNFCSVSCVLY